MPRTALEIIQSAAPAIGIDVPSVLFSSTDRRDVELARVLNECAVRIGRAHDWEALKVLQTHTGDGTTSAYSLPSDYWRMPKEGQIWSTRWQRPMVHISNEDWLRLEIRDYDLVVGNWTLFGGQVQYRPALASNENTQWFYVSENIVAPSSGANKARFTADDDTFRLDDFVLEMELIWKWREQKGMEYAEDMATAVNALEQAITKDKGARIITQSSRRNVRAKVAYPWSIEP